MISAISNRHARKESALRGRIALPVVSLRQKIRLHLHAGGFL
jgi:hypothetical protein